MGVMEGVCDLGLAPNFEVQLTVEKVFLQLTVQKMRAFAFFTEKYSHTAVVAPILRLRLTVETKKLKYKLKPSKHKSLKYKSTL